MGVAMVRGLIVGSKDMGNFYSTCPVSERLLIPFCFVAALVLVGWASPDNRRLRPIRTLEARQARSS